MISTSFFLFCLIVFLGSFTQAITGYGNTLIIVPLAISFLPLSTITGSLVIISLVLNGYLLVTNRQKFSRSLFLSLFLPSLLGVPIGLWLIQHLDPNLLKLFASTAAILSLWIVKHRQQQTPLHHHFVYLIGLVAGVMQSSVSMNGPILSLALNNATKDKDEIRRIFATFLFFSSLFTIFVLTFFEKRTLEYHYGLFCLPAVILGAFAGNKITRHINNELYHHLSYLFILTTSLFIFCASLWQLSKNLLT